MNVRRFAVVLSLVGCAFAAGCSSTSGGGGPGGGGGPVTVNIDEKEPNDGPDLAGSQDIGVFSTDKIVIVKGNLASGGNDGTKYTGDFDLFSFKVDAPGSIDVNVDWTAAADVDFALYDGSLKTIISDGTTNKPAVGSLPSASGQYILGLFSKDNATPYTLTITYKKTATTGADAGGTCPTTPIVAANHTGGCNIDVVTPVCAVADLRNGASFELDWTTNQTFCEGPHKIQISGDPPSNANSVFFSIASTYSGSDASMTRNIGGFMKITSKDIATITSSSGIYYWGVASFYGSSSEGRAFRVIQ